MEYNAILSQIRKELECFIQTAVVDSGRLSDGISLHIKACLHRSDALGAGNDVGEEAVLLDIDLSKLSQRTQQHDEDQNCQIVLPSPGSELRSPGQLENVSSHSLLSSDNESLETYIRRKHTGGLRLKEISSRKIRRLNAEGKTFPQRRKPHNGEAKMEPSSLDKLIRGIWEQLHGSLSFDLKDVIDQWNEARQVSASRLISDADSTGDSLQHHSDAPSNVSFRRMSQFCQRMTQASKSCRALEVIVQARWVESFNQRVETLGLQNPTLSATECRMKALAEACEDFGWSQKDLRNKLAIWRGYKEIQEAAGWVALIFAGSGLYRFCKYRVSFTGQSMKLLRSMQQRFEVAADTIHPKWRQMLSIIGEHSQPKYSGHPHDWVVSRDYDPLPLRETYLQWNPDFSFEHLEKSVVDQTKWDEIDPRQVSVNTVGPFSCETCGKVQSETAENQCHCFPDLFGSGRRRYCPVQVFRTDNGKNNGLISCCSFERGAGIGEFIGLITNGISDLDVMQGCTEIGPYQIYQGSQGNYTRFVNHSCTPNSQFERFTWLGVQRIVLVSKGIEPGVEITVDYSDEYWGHLDKKCLCGAQSCRYLREELIPG